jgi:hypothetical protein
MVLAAAALLPVGSASAVVVYVPGTPPTATRNTTAPTGTLTNSGWQLQGEWAGAFLGTPISSNQFITAQHVGGGVGGTFSFNSTNYTTTGFVDVPNSDLRIWQVSGTFPTFAPLYNSGSDGPETGKPLVVFGRGVAPGAAVNGPATPTGTELKGWEWGAGDGLHSWGENDVTAIVATTNLGDFISFTFDRSVGDVPGTNESHLSAFDSGGGLFIESGGVWKLAGINFGVDGPFKFQQTDATSFNATLFDKGGLWEHTSNAPVTNDPIFTLNPESAVDVPGTSYSSRISSNLGFINTVIPEPSSVALLGGAIALITMRRRRR